MSRGDDNLPKKELPERIHRELRKGETIFHSDKPYHVSAKYPDGKWIGQVRRDDAKGKLVKYPVKGFGTPKEALEYVKSLRPDERGKVHAVRQGEPTVTDLYEFVTKQRQKRIAEVTKDAKKSRWETYIKPEWGDLPLSRVTKRAAQEWVTDMETKIEDGLSGSLGLSQFQKVRTDLHAMFEAIDSFSSDYEDRKNPFADLDFTPENQRAKVTIESQHFAAIYYACHRFIEEELCVDWIAQKFLTSLLGGLRRGETTALCRDQLDFKNGAITVDRAMRINSRAIDPKTHLETGPLRRQAMHYPKGGSAANQKRRVVPMSDQLAKILKPIAEQPGVKGAEWDLLWPSETGVFRQQTLFTNSWKNLSKRLSEVAILAPINHEGPWPQYPKKRGWAKNPVVFEARRSAKYRLPDIFGDIDFRDTRNSFASYMNEVAIIQATREHILGHGAGLTNTVYTVVTSVAFQEARQRLTDGWKPFP